jgi:hypothetical protein
LLGYLAPLAVIVALAISVRRPEFALHPLLAWVFVGRWKFTVMAIVVAMIFSALVPRLPQPRERRALGILVAVAVLYFSVWRSLSRLTAPSWLRSKPRFRRTASAGRAPITPAVRRRP